MKQYLLFLGILVSSTLIAQPEITQADLIPVIGSTASVDSVEYIDVSAMIGANQTWDFSDIEITAPSYPYTWVQPANAGGGSNFPDADYAIQVEFVSIFLGLSNNEFREVGYHLELGGTTSTEIFSDPTIRFELPLSYGASGSDTFASSTTSSFGSQSTSEGEIVWDVPAYGTLILPWGTFTDVLLVHDVETSEDVEEFGGFQFTSTTENDVYSFYQSGSLLPILIFESLTIDDLGGNTTQYMGTVFNADGGSKVDEVNENTLQVYPNPTSGTVRVVLPSSNFSELTLWTTDGRLVQNFLTQGRQSIALDMSELPAGIYVLIANGAEANYTSRVIRR